MTAASQILALNCILVTGASQICAAEQPMAGGHTLYKQQVEQSRAMSRLSM